MQFLDPPAPKFRPVFVADGHVQGLLGTLSRTSYPELSTQVDKWNKTGETRAALVN